MTVLVTLIVADIARSLRLLAASMARWAAERIYVAAGRDSRRPEEWEALVRESVPSDISALCLGISFAVFAVTCLTGRQVRSVMARARDSYARLTEIPVTSLDPAASHWEEHRKVSLALLASALEMRERLADAQSLSQEEADSRRSAIRRLSAEIQLQAANASLLDPATLGGPAGRLGTVAARLADQAFPPSGVAVSATGMLDLSALDKSISAFKHRAAAVSRDLAARRSAVPPGLAEQAVGRDLASQRRSPATEQRGAST